MRRVTVTIGLILLIALIPAVAFAHPLGNFTINHHIGVNVGAEVTNVEYVVDMAEIPAFQELRLIDADHDDTASPEELSRYATGMCESLSDGLVVSQGSRLALVELSARAQVLPGQGGLSVLRIECGYSTGTRPGPLTIENHNYETRIGWREIIATSTDIEIDTDLPSVSPSDQLTTYPSDITLAPDVRSGTVNVGSGVVVTDATASGTNRPVTDLLGLDLMGTGPAAGLLAALAALVLGVGHALAPGHGKTLTAAFLVGQNGRPRQAVLLGLSVAVSHTIGVAVLGLLTVVSTNAFHPEQVYPWLSSISALIVTAMGVALLARAVRARSRRQHGHSHDHLHGHSHETGHSHHHQHDHSHSENAVTTPKEVRYGWRSLALLGLAGGLVPSASAVVLLLSAVNLGNPVFGLVLVACFGIGMSAALIGAGLLALSALRIGNRLGERARGLRHVMEDYMPALAGLAITAVGAVLILNARPWMIF